MLYSDSSEEDCQVERIYRERTNFDFDVSDFQERFRVSHHLLECLTNKLAENLIYDSERNMALTVKQQLLLTLRFLASNGFYNLTGDAHGIHKSTVCRTVKRVTRSINNLYNEYVRFPTNCSPQFCFEIANFPSVCACIDGSYVKIKCPSTNESQFVNRHGQHSLNVVFVAGADQMVYFCSPRWPGSVHDARVLRNSALFQLFQFENWRPFPGAVIHGDSAYPCNDWLIPPLPNASSQPEQRFNDAHTKTRSSIERTIGVIKCRFNVLQNFLRVKTPTYAAQIVKACVVIHNIIKRHNFDLGDVQTYEEEEGETENIPEDDDFFDNISIESDDSIDNTLSRRQNLIDSFVTSF